MNSTLIFTLRECGPDLMDEAADKLAKATEPMDFAKAEYDTGFYDLYVVYSSKIYEVLRFGTFYRCSCRDFEFSGSACKHISLVAPRVCRVCLGNPVEVKGTVCGSCQQKARASAMDNAPYLKQGSSDRKPEKIGNIRI